MSCKHCHVRDKLEFDVDVLKHCSLCEECLIKIYNSIVAEKGFTCTAKDDCVTREYGFIRLDALADITPDGEPGIEFDRYGKMWILPFCPACILQDKNRVARNACKTYRQEQALKKTKRKFTEMLDGFPLTEQQEKAATNMLKTIEQVEEKKRRIDELSQQILETANKIENAIIDF